MLFEHVQFTIEGLDQVQKDYLISNWILGSIGALFLIWLLMWAVLVIWKAIFKRAWHAIRTWRMTSDRYTAWQLARVADGFTDVLEDLVLDGTLSASRADELARSLAHHNGLWDMLPRGNVKLPTNAESDARWRELERSTKTKLVDAIPFPDVSWRGKRPGHQFFRNLRNRINRRNGHQGD